MSSHEYLPGILGQIQQVIEELGDSTQVTLLAGYYYDESKARVDLEENEFYIVVKHGGKTYGGLAIIRPEMGLSMVDQVVEKFNGEDE